MNILAIECSGLVASAAVMADGKMVGEMTTNLKKTHSQTLLPMMDMLLSTLSMKPEQMDAVAVAAGPGSFTGLRIGSATAKGIGLALNLPVIEVPTVDAIAYNAFGYPYTICPMMDAKRQQVYTGLYTCRNGAFEVIRPQCAVPVDEIIDAVNAIGEPVFFLGDGIPVYEEVIRMKCTVPCTMAPGHMAYQRAGALGALAAAYAAEGTHIVTAAAHQPDYLRLSQAERELAARRAAQAERESAAEKSQKPEADRPADGVQA